MEEQYNRSSLATVSGRIWLLLEVSIRASVVISCMGKEIASKQVRAERVLLLAWPRSLHFACFLLGCSVLALVASFALLLSFAFPRRDGKIDLTVGRLSRC